MSGTAPRPPDPLIDAAEHDSIFKTALDLEVTDVEVRILAPSPFKEYLSTLTILTAVDPKEVNRRLAMLSTSGFCSNPQ